MKLLKKIRQVGEAFLLLLGFCVIPWLPRWCVRGLARGLGDLGRVCSPALQRIARANLDLAFGTTRSEADKTRIIRESYRIFALLLLDMFWFAMFSERRLRRLVTFDGEVAAYQATRPALLVTAHFGNWEVMGLATALVGDPIISVAMPVKNPVADYLLAVLRRRTGQRIERRTGAVKAMLKALRGNGRVAVLLDQNTLPREGGVFVDFFGVPVPVSRAAASLVRHAHVPVIIAYSVSEPGGRYRLFAQAPLHLDVHDEVAATQTILSRIEAVIRERPEQWLWMYKRWKYVPAGADRTRYPFYARPAPAEG